MLETILWYLFIGVVFNFIVDMSSEYAAKKGIEVPEGTDWDMQMRFIAMLIWPIGLIVFLKGYIQTRYKNKK
tara:strand:+ start:113 stop:328 length:216 start_codon:yes stop_codon:yes gene_type:complete